MASAAPWIRDDHPITRLDAAYAGPDRPYESSAFVTQNHRGRESILRHDVGVAHAASLDCKEDLVIAWIVEFDVLENETTVWFF